MTQGCATSPEPSYQRGESKAHCESGNDVPGHSSRESRDTWRGSDQRLTTALTPAISAGSADRSEGTTYCTSGVMRTAGVTA